MAHANIHDRASIALLYPPDAFAADAAANDRHRVDVLHGVRILSAPDAAGNFALERAKQHTGEVPQAIFLAPFHRATASEHAAADPDPHHGYEAFLDDIVRAARRHGFRAEASPGPGEDPLTGRPGDPRLRGPRQ